MQSISESSIAALLKNKTVYLVRPERLVTPEKSARREATDEVTQTPPGRRRAAQMFRQELHMRFKLRFASSFEAASRQPTTSLPYRETTSPAGVAADVLQTARQIAAAEPGSRESTLAGLRESLQEAGTAGLAAAESGEERAAVRDAADLVDRGLTRIEEQPVVSRYDALEVDARSKQRTSIQIRTQEGDVVRFDLRQVDKLSLSEISQSDADSSSQEMNLSVSSQSRLVLRVKGDLNDAELEAIRSVFATAESLADEFFSGDINAALEIAAGLEFDAEQLARVSMRFRSVEQVRATQYSSIGTETPQTDETVAEPPTGPTGNVSATTPVEGIAVKPSVEPVVIGPVTDLPAAEVDELQPLATDGPGEGTTAPAAGFGSLLEYLGKLADYLEETAVRFRESFESSVSANQVRFELTQSLQLEILRTVMTVKAPESVDAESAQSGEVIRQLDVMAESSTEADD